MRCYLDVCCLNRPFDDQSQPRIKEEAEAINAILEQIRSGEHEWFSSEAVIEEISRHPDSRRRLEIELTLLLAHETVRLSEQDWDLAQQLVDKGLHPMDAIHVAVANNSMCEYFFTTDDALLTKTGKLAETLRVSVVNPNAWRTGVTI